MRSARSQKATVESPRAGYRPRFSRSDKPGQVELPVLDGELVARAVDPLGWEPLRRFHAGGSERSDAAREVNESARKLYAGHVAPQAIGVPGPPFQRFVAVVRIGPTHPELVGWCGVGRRHLCEVPTRFTPGGYIFALGTDEAYRGCLVRFEGELMRPGSAVMIATLRQVQRDWGGEMPYVWARVKPENLPSHRLFDRHGFISFPRPGIESITVRPARLSPP